MNKTKYKVRLCQYSTDFIIADMDSFKEDETPKPLYIFYYDFIPQDYFLEIEMGYLNQE